MFGRQAVAGRNGQLRAARQVHPVEMAHERQVRRCGTQCDLASLVPLWIGGLDFSQRAFDAIGLQRTSDRLVVEQHSKPDVYQPRMVLVAVEHAKVPLPRSVLSWA